MNLSKVITQIETDLKRVGGLDDIKIHIQDFDNPKDN